MIVILIDTLLTAFLLAVDLISKHFVSEYLLAHGGVKEVIKNVLTFRYSENTGAAFGMLEDSRVLLSVLVGIVIAALIAFMVYHIVKGKHKERGALLLHISLSLIVAGGIGNLVDRIALGYVRDFIEYTIVYTLFKRDFAICNMADVFLTVGVILLVIYLIVFYAASSEKQEKKDGEEGVFSTSSASEKASDVSATDPESKEQEADEDMSGRSSEDPNE